MSRDEEEFIIAPLLKHGAENATTTRSLKFMTGVKSERKIREIVKKERKQGALILSDTRCGRCGYFLPKNREECEHFVQAMRARGVSTLENIKNVADALKRSAYGGELYRQLEISDILREVDGT